MERETTLKLPLIGTEDSFVQVVKKLSFSIIDAIPISCSVDSLRTTSAGNGIRELVEHLVKEVHNPALVHALLVLKWHFSRTESSHEDRGLAATRATACEIIAWRFLARLSERDIVDSCLFELPNIKSRSSSPSTSQFSRSESHRTDESTSLLPQFRSRGASRNLGRPASQKAEILRSASAIETYLEADDDDDEEDPTKSFAGLNALEVAAVADAKQFLSQRIVQKVINGIWCGDITFWGSLDVRTKKKAGFYNKKKADPYSRLRVPKYIKLFEVLFFATFLALYYAVLVERNPAKVTPLGILLYVWIAAFAYDELSEFWDAGSLFYAVDFWNAWDLCIIIVGLASFITRVIGLVKHSDGIIDTAFDILSLEALFLVPRICSLLSLYPYFGTLIPCLKAMTKDFVKFMVVVAILYIGFLTTFIMLARDHFTPSQMTWILIRVFFGSSYLGFDIMDDISPILGPPLMLIFICLSTILLITALISILSASFANVSGHAREEYLFVYSVYVLEASTSNRLTHFYPPLNLIPLFLLRPLRLFVPSERLRAARIKLLKITHTPIVGLIWIIESFTHDANGKSFSAATTFGTTGPRPTSGVPAKKKQKPFLSGRDSVRIFSQDALLSEVDEDDPSSGIPHVRSKKEGKRSSEGSGEASPGQAIGQDLGDKFHELGSQFHRQSLAGQKSLEDKFDDLSAQFMELKALILAQQARGTPGQQDD